MMDYFKSSVMAPTTLCEVVVYPVYLIEWLPIYKSLAMRLKVFTDSNELITNMNLSVAQSHTSKTARIYRDSFLK